MSKSNGSNVTRARPIHVPGREIRSVPDDNEPSYSYEEKSFLAAEHDVEDEFLNRLSGNRRDSGGAFWRTKPAASAEPAFSSVSMMRNETDARGNGRPVVTEIQVNATERGADRTSFTESRKESNASSQVSTLSSLGASSVRDTKKNTVQRSRDRRNKLDAQHSDFDLGRIECIEDTPPILIPPTDGSLSRGASDQSGIYNKALIPRNGVLLGKSSSLIFPTGVEGPAKESSESAAFKLGKVNKVNLLLDQCEAIRFPFKRKLCLENLNLAAADIPMKDLMGTALGNSLHKLSLAGNRLTGIPDALVVSFPVLKHLDLSNCDLVSLPEKWLLPQLKRLNLSQNRLTDFPDEIMLEGLLALEELNMESNKVSEIIIPSNTKLMSKLETLNLSHNDLSYLPEDMDQLKSLRILKVERNFLEKVPMRICDMDIRSIDVSRNPIIMPPIETCERGICSMKRYYHCLRSEEHFQHKSPKELQRITSQLTKKDEKCKLFGRFFGSKGTPSHSMSNLSTKSSFHEDAQSPKDEAVILLRKTSEVVLTRDRSISCGEVMSRITSASDSLLSSSITGVITPSHDVVKSTVSEEWISTPVEDVTYNDTLKVIFVGMAMAGKTSMIKRLIEGRNADIPLRDERTIGVDIYEWDPKTNTDRRPVDTKMELEGEVKQDVFAKFSVWDFAGQHVYHATHELFFSPRSLYVLVWDMGATNESTMRRKSTLAEDKGAFKLSYDSSDEEDEDDFVAEEEERRADRALERDIDEKVQFWVECIQACAPGAAILPVATFDDYFDKDEEEAKHRCDELKHRLLKHEERRIAGIQERLAKYEMEHRANDAAALKLRKLLCPYTRPKLLFGNDGEESVVRVSGTKYTGFERLTEKIVNMATGRDKAGSKYHIFRGHVGAQIPRMRLEVRDAVRGMRDRFKVVEWGYFLKTLAAERNLTNVDDISDALHFLTNIGELSFFGNVFPDRQQMEMMLLQGDGKQCSKVGKACQELEVQTAVHSFDDDDDDDDEDFDQSRALMSIDDTNITAPSTREDFSVGTFDDVDTNGLSQFVFLNPRWLVTAVACILRHDLDREIRETRRSLSNDVKSDHFYNANLNCPVITADDACMLWQSKRFTRKAADRAQIYSNNMAITPFNFLQRLLVRFGVFVPIDLTIEKAFLGGKEYARHIVDDDKPAEIITFNTEVSPQTPQFFFLPSLLGPGEPAEAWTYKNTDSWKATLCHSILFPDGVPPGLMERITASVLSSVYAVSKGLEQVVLTTGLKGQPTKTLDGALCVKEILCWRTAFFLKLGTVVRNDSSGEMKESIVEIFAHLVDRDSHLCVGSKYMGSGTRRLIVSAKGQVGDGGRKIWSGGYLLVLKSVNRLMSEYGGLEFEKQGFCPECLSKKAVSEASHWDWTVIHNAAQNGDGTMRCGHGHRVDTRLITGPCGSLTKQRIEHSIPTQKYYDSEPIVPVNDLLRGIVLVGLWDGKTRKIVRVGSGFVVDKKRGLIVTAAHTLMNIWGDKNYPFGENYYGMREGKVVIGVIPRKKESDTTDGTEAVFRYFASIVAKDTTIESTGECQIDACILRITTRMETDISGNGDGCGDQPEILLQNNPEALKREKFQQLKVTEKCELDEQVRILGYNQGGEGILGPGESLNRYMDFARGYVCKKFARADDIGLRRRFKPREEIVVICPTIGGHSGGPCVNQQGEVIGILSRADPAESQRCYLVPASAWKSLLKEAKSTY